MPLLLASGRLHLFWVELDGRPAVAEYFLLGDDATYSYQAGLNPDCMDDSPGRLGNLLGLRHAMGLGHRAFDFLRGDEPYKAHFRVRPGRCGDAGRGTKTRLAAAVDGMATRERHEALGQGVAKCPLAHWERGRG